MNIINYGDLILAIELATMDGEKIRTTINKDYIVFNISCMTMSGLSKIIMHYHPIINEYVGDTDADVATDIRLVFEYDEITDFLVV